MRSAYRSVVTVEDRVVTKPDGSYSKSISNLSISLMESAFLLLVERSLPVYQHNIGWDRPPVAMKENVNAAAAIVMLVTGLDYHLCRLKYLRDVAKHPTPLPYTPYFEWTFGDALLMKFTKLLNRPKERRLLTQLIEMTVCRDAIVHPKFYTVTHSWYADFAAQSLKAELIPGVTLRPKAIQNKMQRKHFTKSLKLALVPTWVGYVDAVACILVLSRFLNVLESRYGNPYAWVGGITAYEKQTKGLFTAWNWHRSHPRELEDWAKAFFQSLSSKDQNKVRNNLGGRVEPYLKKKRPRTRKLTGSKRSLSDIMKAVQAPPQKPDFLRKPPPHLME